MSHIRTLALVWVPVLVLVGCGDSGAPPEADGFRLGPIPTRTPVQVPRLVFVPNGTDPFWDIARAGVLQAGEDFGLTVDVRAPSQASEQKAIVEELIARDVDGIAISPIDGENQTQLIDEAAQGRFVITHDSDAAASQRICFIGVDNYAAGKLCGELVAEAIPDGGKVLLFIGRLSQSNAQDRRRGVIDALRTKGSHYVILDTMTDDFDRTKAKANAEDALARHPDLACMVGLFAYNAPQILVALEGAGKLGQVKVVSFDEQEPTLRGIQDGHVQGTVVQDPYAYGYESMRILGSLARGDRSVLPPSGFLEIPARAIRQADVAAFRQALEDRLTTGRK